MVNPDQKMAKNARNPIPAACPPNFLTFPPWLHALFLPR